LRKGLAEDLLYTANDLLNAERLSDAHLRRAVSAVYYALFHFLSQLCADSFIGAEPDTKAAWKQVYRSLDHGMAKKACGKIAPGQGDALAKKFPQAIREFANLFFAGDITDMISNARAALENFGTVSPQHRKAFAAFVLFKNR